MQRLKITVAIALCYFVFAILLNSVGTVILQSINSFDVSKVQASTLEGFKDLSIAFVSFFIASFIPRLGYKLALLLGLSMVLAACLITPLFPTFVMIQLLFAVIGTAFALVKVSVYAMVGQLTGSAREHSSLLNTIEGVFMLGVLSGYWVFSYYIDPTDPSSLGWLNVYYLLGGVLIAALLIVQFTPFAQPQQTRQSHSPMHDFVAMLKLTYQPLVLIFVISIFLYVLIEQGIGSWLPTFNREVLHLPLDVSVQITSIFAASLAVGRLLAGQLLRRISWYPFLNGCLVLMAVLMLATLPMTQQVDSTGVTSIWQAPTAAFILPLVGIVMAPLYPILNSVMLSALAPGRQASMTGLIVVFSALGGTTGSIVTGVLFEHLGGQSAFYTLLVPVAGIACALALFRRFEQHSSARLLREQEA